MDVISITQSKDYIDLWLLFLFWLNFQFQIRFHNTHRMPRGDSGLTDK